MESSTLELHQLSHTPAAKSDKAAPINDVARAADMLLDCCSGLLVTKNLLADSDFTSDYEDVQERLRACQLGLGDALVIAHRAFHCDPIERHQALWSWIGKWGGWADEVLHAHAEAISGATEPCTREALRTKCEALIKLVGTVWLWLEDQRLLPIIQWNSVADYVRHPGNKTPEETVWQALLQNLRAYGLRGLSTAPFRSPRARLFVSMPLLLWVQPLTPDTVALLQTQLMTKSSKRGDLVNDYLRLWENARCETGLTHEEREPGWAIAAPWRSSLESI